MSFLRRFSKYLRGQRSALFLGSGAILLNTVMDLIKPWPLKVVVDNVIRNEPHSGGGLGGWLVGLAGSRVSLLNLAITLAIVAVLLGAFFEYYGKRTLGTVGQNMMVNLRTDVFSILQRRSLAFHDRRQVGDLVTRVTGDSDKMQEALVHTLTMLIPAAATMLAMGTIMVVLDWQVALLALCTTPVLFFLTFGLGRSMRRAAKDARRHDGAVAAMATETLSSIRVVQAFTREDEEDRRFSDYAVASSMAGRRALEMEARYGPLVDVTNVVGSAIMIWFGAQRVINGFMSIGELLIFIAYLGAFYKPMKQLSKLTQHVAKGVASAERIGEILEDEVEIRDAPNAVTCRRAEGRVRFDHVTYGYEPRRAVLHDISLEIAPGEVVALVGPTGAGKSTLVGLIPRFDDPWSGRVGLDNRDVRSYTVRSLRDQIAMVLQDPILFRGSIYDNIAYGAPDATYLQVLTAAQAANVDEFVRHLPEGYDTVVGERGVTLSGGQRQRISIARALVRNAPVIILDEPTSGLDSASEKLVLDALEHLMKGRTTIIIAHRLSTARRADRILVIAAGRIAEQGSHEELLAAGGIYRRFHDVQFDTTGEPAVIDLTEPAVPSVVAAEARLRPTSSAPVSAPKPGANGHGEAGSSNGDRSQLPSDPQIPALSAIADVGVDSVLARAGLEGRVDGIRLLKWHPGSRCTLTATVGGRKVVVKAYRRERGDDVELMRRLDAAGLATGKAPTAARLIGEVRELNLLVFEWLEGTWGSDLVLTGRGALAGRRGAEWLHAVARSGVDYGEHFGPAHALNDAAESARVVAEADTGLGRRALACAEALAVRAPEQARNVLVHGSFSIGHIVDTGTGPGVVDWDGFAQGAIELDAGRFLARLALHHGRSAARSAAIAADAFRHEAADLLEPEALDWYTTLALLRLTKYRARRGSDGWQQRAAVLLDAAEQTLGVRT